MGTSQRFAIGGLGGLLPPIVGLLSYDLSSVIDNIDLLTTGALLGYLIRTAILVGLGGIFAAFQDVSAKRVTLLQMGIAAPAIITTYINGAAVLGVTSKASATATFSIGLV